MYYPTNITKLILLHDFQPKLADNSTPFFAGPFGINVNREIVNQPNGAMTFNGTKLYTLAFNHTTNQISTYINGELKRTLSLTSRFPLRCKTFGGYSKFYNVSVYDRALTDSEVLQNYNSIISRLTD